MSDSEEGFWSKPKKYAIAAGRKYVELALQFYSKYYSEEGFWSKLKKYAIAAGRKCVELALQFYYALQSPETPKREKAIILGALGYFISPIDAVPDVLPGGFVDDTWVIGFAVAKVATYITDKMKDKAKCKVDKWFGKEEEDNKGK